MTISKAVLAGFFSAVLLVASGGVAAFKGERDRRVWAELDLQELKEELEAAKLCLSLHAAEAKALRYARQNSSFPGEGRSVIEVYGCKGFLIMGLL